METSQIASRYEIVSPQPGRANFVRNGAFWDVTIEIGSQTVYGLATIAGSRLAIAIGPKDKMEIGAYQIAGDRAAGLWVPPAAKGDSLLICGREKLVREDAQVWRIEEAVAIDHSTYSGKITVTPITPPNGNLPGIVGMTWNLNDGVYSSFALHYPSALLSCWNLGEKAPHGIIVLEGDGQTFSAVTAMQGGETVSVSQWKRA